MITTNAVATAEDLTAKIKGRAAEGRPRPKRTLPMAHPERGRLQSAAPMAGPRPGRGQTPTKALTPAEMAAKKKTALYLETTKTLIQIFCDALRANFKAGDAVDFHGAYPIPTDPLVTPSVKDHKKLASGHRTRFWCSQDEARKKKSKASQNPDVCNRDNVGMKRYACGSKLTISCRTGKNDDEQLYVTVVLKHAGKYVSYVDVLMPPEALDMIHENVEWLTPVAMVTKVQAAFPQVTAAQIHRAWMEISEVFWRFDDDQLLSTKKLLEEHLNDVDIFEPKDVPEGVEMLCWGMKKVATPLKGKLSKSASTPHTRPRAGSVAEPRVESVAQACTVDGASQRVATGVVPTPTQPTRTSLKSITEGKENEELDTHDVMRTRVGRVVRPTQNLDAADPEVLAQAMKARTTGAAPPKAKKRRRRQRPTCRHQGFLSRFTTCTLMALNAVMLNTTLNTTLTPIFVPTPRDVLAIGRRSTPGSVPPVAPWHGSHGRPRTQAACPSWRSGGMSSSAVMVAQASSMKGGWSQPQNWTCPTDVFYDLGPTDAASDLHTFLLSGHTVSRSMRSMRYTDDVQWYTEDGRTVTVDHVPVPFVKAESVSGSLYEELFPWDLIWWQEYYLMNYKLLQPV
ncbi:hypothetical protein B0H10DRAFT_1948543 [Mycena sp. CBHHK59/15]|nr:hypothetical protein B0H10DRAFT_1948543 [Mycena sp. CBHHK59/15]